jgi:hypothetical protein
VVESHHLIGRVKAISLRLSGIVTYAVLFTGPVMETTALSKLDSIRSLRLPELKDYFHDDLNQLLDF